MTTPQYQPIEIKPHNLKIHLDLFYSGACLHWVMPKDVKSVMPSRQGERIQNQLKQIWRTVP
ncbi:hypothetical protein H5410_032110 [Solanum commersonii]|uniref:Uncharacterized protein n=1 Tax=Solanum commersonii TaxID=4109 RepID=A0A9J5YNP6_SOLCO|nr:hypothetical protein H5410_032110 [Solanum commersonii]